MNQVVFETQGDWDTTTLICNGEEFLAAQMFVHLVAGRDDFGEPTSGGIYLGGEITAIVRPQDNPNEEIGILPGRLEMRFPNHQIVIENMHPGFAFEATRVYYNGSDVTDDVLEVLVDIDSIRNNVEAHLMLYRDRFLLRDEIATFKIL